MALVSFRTDNKPSQGRGLLQSQQPLDPSLEGLRSKITAQLSSLKRRSEDLEHSLQVFYSLVCRTHGEVHAQSMCKLTSQYRMHKLLDISMSDLCDERLLDQQWAASMPSALPWLCACA